MVAAVAHQLHSSTVPDKPGSAVEHPVIVLTPLPGRLNGGIVDSESKAVVESVTVMIVHKTSPIVSITSSISDAQGCYSIHAPCLVGLVLHTSHPCYLSR